MKKNSTNSSPSIASVAIASSAAFLLLVGEHYLLPTIEVPFTYIAGVLALLLPFSAWCAFYRLWWSLVAIWSITAAGGTAVVGAYTVDWARAGADWLAGAGLLVMALVGALVLALGVIVWLYQNNRRLRAVVALQRGMGHEQQQQHG